MRKLGAVALTAMALGLFGCDDTPSDSIVNEQNKKQAETEAIVPSIKVVDLVKENAWYDQGNKMRYTVRHNYNLQLTKSFGEVALEIAKDMDKDAQKNAQGGLMGAAQNMATGMFVGQMQADPTYKDRFRAILKQCEPCGPYLFNEEVDKSIRGDRIIHFHLAWNWLVERGFPEAETTTSTKIPRQAWTTFMNTEKGWLPASS